MTRTKLSPHPFILSFIAFVALVGAVQAQSIQSIGIQFVGGGTALSATESAGVTGVVMNNWNALTGTAFSNVLLQDNSASKKDGVTLTVNGVDFTNEAGGGITSSPAGNATLSSGEIGNYGGGSTTFLVTNIPYAKYDVYVYAQTDAPNRNAVFALSPGKMFDSNTAAYFGTNMAIGTTAWTPATTSWAGSAPQPATPFATSNYVVFTGQKGSAFLLNDTAIDGNGVNGIEIVDTSAAPKPSPLH